MPFPERIVGEHQIEEEEEDENADETGNVSETDSRVVMSKVIFSQSSNPASSGHTRTNSSKAQSLKGSIVKPALSSAFSSTFVSNSNPYGVKPPMIRPGAKLLDQIKMGLGRHTRNGHEGSDLHLYLPQTPGSFVCTGGTEFYYEAHADAKQTPKSSVSSAGLPPSG